MNKLAIAALLGAVTASDLNQQPSLAEYLFGEESQALVAQEENKTKVAEIFQGVVQAYNGNFNVLDFIVCVNTEDQALLAFDFAVKAFEKALGEYEGKDYENALGDFLGSLLCIQGGISYVKKGLPACEHIITPSFDSEGFNKSLAIAADAPNHFAQLVDDILSNKEALGEQMQTAVTAYKAGEFTKFGLAMGEMLQMSTKEVETPKVTQNDITEFAQGVLKGTQVGDFNYTQLLICIYEASQDAEVFYAGFDLLEQAYE